MFKIFDFVLFSSAVVVSYGAVSDDSSSPPKDWQSRIAPAMLLTNGRTVDVDSKTAGGDYQGDISGIDRVSTRRHVLLDDMIDDKSKLWPDGKVYYTLGQAFSAGEKTAIRNAMDLVEFKTQLCIRFIPHTTESNFVSIARGLGCTSPVGGCLDSIGGIQHELFHSLGMFHEMTRTDRDHFVWILWENMLPQFRRDFEIARNSVTFGLPYDYESIMHYSFRDFSSNDLPTIIPKIGQPNIGQRFGMTDLDGQKLRRLYNCSTDGEETTVQSTTGRSAEVADQASSSADDLEKILETLPVGAVQSAKPKSHSNPEQVPSFMMLPISAEDCKNLNTDNCQILPASKNCTDGLGLFAACSQSADSGEVEQFLTNIQNLKAGRGLEVRVDGQRKLTPQMLEPGAEFIISLIIADHDNFHFDQLTPLHLPYLTHIGTLNCRNLTIMKGNLQPHQKLTMLILAKSPVEFIEEGAFDKLPALQQIAFDNGMELKSGQGVAPRFGQHLRLLHCDCQYEWLRRFVEERPHLVKGRRKGDIHTWGGIDSHEFTARQNAIPVDCKKDNLMAKPDQTAFSINTDC